MITVKQGRYPCNVGNCDGDGGCVHKWVPYFCPYCMCQLVRVKTSQVVFCSHGTSVDCCDFGSTINKKHEYLDVTQAVTKQVELWQKELGALHTQKASLEDKIVDYQNKLLEAKNGSK